MERKLLGNLGLSAFLMAIMALTMSGCTLDEPNSYQLQYGADEGWGEPQTTYHTTHTAALVEKAANYLGFGLGDKVNVYPALQGEATLTPTDKELGVITTPLCGDTQEAIEFVPIEKDDLVNAITFATYNFFVLSESGVLIPIGSGYWWYDHDTRIFYSEDDDILVLADSGPQEIVVVAPVYGNVAGYDEEVLIAIAGTVFTLPPGMKATEDSILELALYEAIVSQVNTSGYCF